MRKYFVMRAKCPKCGRVEDKMSVMQEEVYPSAVAALFPMNKPMLGTGGFMKLTRLSTCCLADEDRYVLVTVCPDGCMMVGFEE